MDNIEQFDDGTAAFVSAREPAWHALGTITPDVLTAEEALHIAHLDWEVTTVPAFARLETGEFIPVPDKFATVRQHPKKDGPDALGVVGTRYVPIQNVEMFSMLDAIVDDSGAKYETAGAIKQGRQVFLSMKFPKGAFTFLEGTDPTDLYLLATNSHDGTSSLTFAVVPLRVVCQNTLTYALRHTKRTFTLRHTANAKGKAAFTRDALGMTFKYVEQFEKEVKALVEAPFTDAQFDEFLQSLIPPAAEPTGRAATIRENKRDALWGLWRADTQEAVRGTRYAALQTVTEYADWFATAKGADPQVARAERSMLGTAEIKQKALRVLQTV